MLTHGVLGSRPAGMAVEAVNAGPFGPDGGARNRFRWFAIALAALLAATLMMVVPSFASAAPQLTVVKAHTPAGDVRTGETLEYTIDVENTGDEPTATSDNPGDAINVQDAMPEGLTLISVTTDDDAFWHNGQFPDPGCIALSIGGPVQILCAADSQESLAPGESAPTIRIRAKVDPDSTGAITNEASATGAGTSGNIAGVDTFNVTPAPILNLVKSHPGLFRQGDQGVYDLDLTNDGPLPTTGTVTISDTLPAGLTYDSASSDGGYWDCSNVGQDVTCESDAVIPAGDSAPTLHINVDIDPGAPGTVTNEATATGGGAVPGESSDVTPIYSPSAKQIRLSIDPTELASQDGATGTFFRLRNLNNDTNVFLDFTQMVDKPILIGAWDPDDGNAVTIDPSGVSFPSYTIHDLDTGLELGGPLLADAVVNFVPTGPWTGTYDPATGEATLKMDLKITLRIELATGLPGLVVGECETGDASVDSLTTGSQAPPDPDVVPPPVTDGSPFGADSNGALINNDVEIPTVSCPYVNPLVAALAPDLDLGATVSELLGAPAPTGATDMRLEMHAAFPEDNPALSIKVAPEDDIVLGSGGTYDLTVRNNSAVATDGSTITVEDTLPDGLTYEGVDGTDPSWSCSATGQDVTCTNDGTVAGNGSLPPIKLQVGTDGEDAYPSVVNFATVEGGGSEGVSTGSHLTAIAAPVLGLTFGGDTAGAAYTVGMNAAVFTPTVRNSGDLATSGPVTLSGVLPRGMRFVSSSNPAWTCTPGAYVPAGQTVSCVNTTPIAPGGTSGPGITASVSAAALPNAQWTWSVSGGGAPSSTNPGPVTSNTHPVVQPQLALTVTHTGDFAVGGEGSYTLTVQNVGLGTATTPTSITDNLPDGLRFVSASPTTAWDCSASGQTVSCNYRQAPTNLAAGATATPLVITVAVENEAYPSVTNRASATAPNSINTAQASDPTNVTADPSLDIVKSHSGDFTVGEQGSFDIDVINTSPVDSDGTTVTVTDSLPAGLTFASASSAGDYWSCSDSGQDVTCTSDEVIAAGDMAPTLTIDTEVGDAAVPGVTNTAEVTGGGFAGTAESSDSVIVEPAPGPPPGTDKPILAIDKTHQGDFQAGQSGQYRIAVSNTGEVASTGTVTVVDALPIGLSYESASGAGWSCSANGQRVTCTSDAAIAAGGDATAIDLTVKADGDATPGVTNTASVQGGGAVAQAIAYDPTKVNPAPKPRLTSVKVAPKAKRVKAGKAVTLRVKVTNGGNARASGVSVCAKVPKKKAKASACKRIAIAARSSKTVKLKVRTKKRARGNAKVTVTARSGSAGSRSDSATLKIRR